MRVRKQKNGITVNAIAGTHVVFLGLDLEDKYHKGFLGFALKRLDHSDGELIWLKSQKTFKETEPNPAIGEQFSTLKHPIQSFQWADYSVAPGNKYTYTICGVYGNPASLENKREVEVVIKSEVEIGPTHSVFFNRGSVATQEYARRFMNKTPDKAGPGAYEWLSRGLLEAMIKFIDGTKKGEHIHGAVYEFQYPDVLKALTAAQDRGVKVQIIYDDVENYTSDGEVTGPWQENEKAVRVAKLKNCIKRKNAKLMHNKFFVISDKNAIPYSVWTGSTNITLNGIFGHSNLGHIVNDGKVAESFKAYWDRLAEDPEIQAEYRDANMEATPVPNTLKKGTTTISSPRGTKLDSLEWYADIASKAESALLMTFAFGMHEKFKEIYKKEDGLLRMALMDKAYASPKVKARDEVDIQEIRNLPNVVIAIGNRIVTNVFDRWLKEMYTIDGKGKHVLWIHTKYMIVDPLGNEPIIITGSANFSKASTDINDENMIVIKGDKRITDIYFGEYNRLFSHYSFREAVKWSMEKEENGKPSEWKPQYLISNDTWMKDYFNPRDKSGRFKRREYFAGPMSI